MAKPTVALVALLLAFGLTSAGAEPFHIPLSRRSRTHPLDLNERANRLLLKYGLPPRLQSNVTSVPLGKRASSSSVAVTNHETDNDYFASLEIGSPPQTLNVILDTGSSDLWLAGSTCSSGCDPQALLYQSSKSSSFQGGTGNALSGLGVTIKLNYGSGSATGRTGQETVSMGGFTLTNQVFLDVSQVSGNITDADVSGIMGLAFVGLAQTTALPFWQALVRNNQLSSPEMSFYLARSSDPNKIDVDGGMFTLGGTNPSLFTGEIEFQNISMQGTNNPLFWSLPVSDITIDGKSVPFPTIPGNGALDTGTTLITGATQNVQAFWAAVPNSGPSPTAQGFYNFPCNTQLNVAFSFGGKSWAINEADMNLGQDPGESSKCVGAIFDGGIPANAGLSWIIGDTFLKNVYSVFRATPPSVGLAQLSSQAGGSKSGGSISLKASNVALLMSMLIAIARICL
ncbi:acid protease [Pholiota conissans]|uniref:Acid protease n=1 Tax=Pholiota conissans TaxID=109636 RepID=A0A9P5YR26_9AGAR|nr:acid protease [Pholiota conissans]